MLEGGGKDAEEMNENQKKVLLLTLISFLLSVVYVPEQTYTTSLRVPFFVGWTLISDLSYDIALTVLLIEWAGIVVVSLGLFFYFKEK